MNIDNLDIDFDLSGYFFRIGLCGLRHDDQDDSGW